MLSTLRHLNDINGFRINRNGGGFNTYVRISDKDNVIAFRLQDGPTKDVGLNGCSLNTVISAVRQILEGLNDLTPCEENSKAIEHLKSAYIELEKRKLDREKRGVYGTGKV
jgi:hypothetical protein